MPQANTADRTSAPSADELTDLCTAIYTVSNHVRRPHQGDPVEAAHVRVLAVAQRLGPLRPSDLACALRLDLSTVSRHLRSLQDAGLVRIEPDPDDGRAQLVALTDAGDAAFDVVMDNRRAAIGAVVEHWSPADRAALTELLGRLAEEITVANPAPVRPATARGGA